MKVTAEGAVLMTSRERACKIKREKSKESRASCPNAIYQFWQTKTSQYVKNRCLSYNYFGSKALEMTFSSSHSPQSGLKSCQESLRAKVY